MFDGLPAELLSRLGPWGVITLIVVMILTDRLITRRRLDDTREERDQWRKVADERLEAMRVGQEQVAEQVAEVAKTLHQLIESGQRARQRGSR